MNKLLIFVAFLLLFPFSAIAGSDQLDDIWKEMRLQSFVEILSEEGRSDAANFSETLFQGTAVDAWKSVVNDIYNPSAMARSFKQALSQELTKRDVSGAITFFQTPLGKKSVELELSARKAMLDPDIDGISRDNYFQMQEDNDPRLELIKLYSDANNLVDENVVGTMNGNYAFLNALAREGQGPFADDPGAILNEIWSQEDEIRNDTTEWIMAYYAFSYQPLTDDEIRGLIDFSITPDGQRLNAALFAAFDSLFTSIAERLATASAKFMVGEQL